jgi:peptidoglycan/LPS O-acetylase OafA/YrhL
MKEIPVKFVSGPGSGPTLSTATGSGRDLPNLDLLRSAAVLSVLAFHIAGAIRTDHYGEFYGAFGVGLFFVHTALVLMWSLERRPNTLDFYVRRVARIYPLSIAVVSITVATHAKVASFPERGEFFLYTAPTIKQVLTHLLLIQNLSSGNFLVYPMWSLPIEVQMYVLLPVLFFFLRKNMALWPLLMLWALAASFAYRVQEVNLALMVPYFLSGLIAYVGFSRWRAMLPGWYFLPVLAAIMWAGGRAGDWHKACFPCLALGLVLPLFRQLKQGLLTKACWQVARYSYGIYLTHPFALLLAFYVGRVLGRPMQFAILLVSLTVFSIGAFHLIESPGMRLGAKAAGALAKRFKMPAESKQSVAP